MNDADKNSTEAGELSVQLTYSPPNDDRFYPEIHNGFRGGFWVKDGHSAAILLVEIPGNSMLPGQTKTVLAYTLSVPMTKRWLSSGSAHWGPVPCTFGSIRLPE
ncbi:hypothetical protein ACFP2F_22770 [Hymenobacter artigasi]|uniref:Uncharacterized protein n=1 Tax=Hymenobacter artigasi TaxID=2719616 RepID=A0ABX1HHB6_9BACT|nr:hypothetical protein [Hymenobacter artigasi]NKI89653.1 hypothetical protein [Hymenobacter artigasi]